MSRFLSDNALREPSPSDWDRWRELLAEGVEPSEAAHAVGYTSSRFKRSDRARHGELIAMSRRVREERRRATWAKKVDAA